MPPRLRRINMTIEVRLRAATVFGSENRLRRICKALEYVLQK